MPMKFVEGPSGGGRHVCLASLNLKGAARFPSNGDGQRALASARVQLGLLPKTPQATSSPSAPNRIGVAMELRRIIGRPAVNAVGRGCGSGRDQPSKIHDAALNRVSWFGGVGISLALKSPARVFYETVTI